MWYSFKKRISVVLIFSMILPYFTHIKGNYVYAKSIEHQFVNELEVDESYIDDGMFYMPYSSFEVNEKDYQTKYYFKVKSKGNAEKAENVKLTMLDMSGKYN